MSRGSLSPMGIGLLGSITAGLVIATVMTFLDYQLNPAGIFRDAGGTRWDIVTQTAWSWFWPVALAVTFTLAAILFAVRRN